MKMSLDKFWLECGKDKDSTQEHISKYYSRVEDANSYFTSCKNGWRTDRGLIHIIFGIPNEITSTPTTETWTYGDSSNLGTVEFVFESVENAFSRNHYYITVYTYIIQGITVNVPKKNDDIPCLC